VANWETLRRYIKASYRVKDDQLDPHHVGFGRRTRLLPLLAVAVLLPAVARADGGTSIANAPELPLGKTVSGARSGLDYWRLTIVSGDTLRVDYEPVATQLIGLCLMAPSVTDFTANDAQCVDGKVTDQSDRKRQTVHELTLPGRYSLIVGFGGGVCVHIFYGVDTKCSRAMAYNLTAYVVHRTTTTLLAVPKVVNRGTLVSVRGQVQGVKLGKVVLQERVAKRWVNRQLAKLTVSGRFTIKLQAATPGTFRYVVRYPGDASHKASKRGFTLTVT